MLKRISLSIVLGLILLILIVAFVAVVGALDNHISVELEVRYEDREGVTLTFYDLDFVGLYRIANSAQAMDSETQAGEVPASAITAELFFPFPGTVDMLHDVQFLVDGEEPADAQYSLQGIRWQTTLRPEEEREIEVRYKAKGEDVPSTTNRILTQFGHNLRGGRLT